MSGTKRVGVPTRSEAPSRSEREVVSVDDCPVLFAVVDFVPAAGRRVRTVVVAFESALAADHFAADHHLDDYTVAPVSFRVDPAFRTGKDQPWHPCYPPPLLDRLPPSAAGCASTSSTPPRSRSTAPPWPTPTPTCPRSRPARGCPWSPCGCPVTGRTACPTCSPDGTS